MRGIFILVIWINFLFFGISYSQTGNILEGIVVDETNESLPGASIILYPEMLDATTDAEGKYIISNLENGTYIIEVSFVGYKTIKDSIVVSGYTKYNAKLELRTLSLQEVVVKDDYAEERKKDESLNIEIVNDEYLKQNRGGSLMNSLERLPGVSTINIGSDQSKPIIRGLGFNRVVVVENGIKHEAQQWGEDHGLEIDQYAVDRVEVLKGPASLMYGSDAIGGVIDMNNWKLPQENTYGASVDLTGKTNNGLLGGSLQLFLRKEKFFAKARATILDYGDFKVPTDSIDVYSFRVPLHNNQMRNTAGKERNLHLSFGLLQRKFQSKFYISYVSGKSGFFANAHGIEPRNVDTEMHDRSSRDINYPYHTIQHLKVINASQYSWENLKLELDIGYQRNFRQELSEYTSHGWMPPVFPDTLGFSQYLERQFDKHVYSGNFRLSYQLNSKTEIKTGISGEYQENRIDGRGFIIPAYNQANLGAYAFGRYRISEFTMMMAGVRFDYGNIRTYEYFDWFSSPVIENGDTTMQYLQRAVNLNRNFSNFTWSLGFSHEKGSWSLKSNIGKSFRMPIAKELAANGVNYHRFSYEIGDPELSPEVSYQFDFGAEYSSPKFAVGITPFVNYFSNYIYLNPTSEYDRSYGNGNQIYKYTESEVFRYGGEIHAHYEVLEFLQLGAIGEYVFSEQLSGEKKGYTLPFSPPPSAIFNLKLHTPELSVFYNPYFSFDFRIAADQNNIVPPEEPTQGYNVINLALGGGIKMKDQKVLISIQVKNLLNTKYFNHTSYYRMINVPEPGRNFIVNIFIPLSGKIK